MSEMEVQVDAELDLRGVMCPYNYVKTKLKLEEMKPGQILAVIIDDGEPIRNVPRSARDEGHKVLQINKLDHAFRVIIEKSPED
jgi:tRNA 2-thiouridine synthesizing protein A